MSLRGFFAAVTVLCFLLSCIALLSSAVRQRIAVANMGAAAEWVPGPQWLVQLLGEDYFGTATMVYSDQQGFTDSDLEHVSHLRDIKQLYLPGTSVTDEGLENLTELHRLEELGLENTQITDAGLAKLGTLRCLRRLILTGTQVTDSGVRDLKEALPNIRVER